MALAVAGTILATTTPASAAVTKFCSLPYQQAGYACFYSDGDKFEVTDEVKDGLRSVVIWTLMDGNRIVRSGECPNAAGYATTVTCNYDFPEGSQMIVDFDVVARNGANGADQYPTPAVIAYVSGR
ncbi:hypothetical protein [Streptomyces sp. NPDC059349]|uniref:hypothetical protein n=1 Tax=Streptomyces sp. NPDC059349 TaxID=3346808 RepID=UPI0036A3569E